MKPVDSHLSARSRSASMLGLVLSAACLWPLAALADATPASSTHADSLPRESHAAQPSAPQQPITNAGNQSPDPDTGAPANSSHSLSATPALGCSQPAASPPSSTARDARVSFGGFSISRPRFDQTASTTPPSTSASSSSPSGAITLPENTRPSHDSSVEPYYQHVNRAQAEQRALDADAREHQARADILQSLAIHAQDADLDDYPCHNVGDLHRRVILHRAPHNRTHARTASTSPSTAPIAAEHFVKDRAQLAFARAARPDIAPAINASRDAQLRWSKAAQPPIQAIQNRIDQAQRGKNLQRESSPD